MNMSTLRGLGFGITWLCCIGMAAHGEIATPVKAATPPAIESPAQPGAAAAERGDFDDDSDADTRAEDHHHHWHTRRAHHDEGGIVSLGHDSYLGSGEKADAVVSIFGSSTSEGESDAVVSIAGNTPGSGAVLASAEAVLGNTYVDSVVDGDVVAVFGDIELGPHAEVGGDVVAVFGTVTRDPAAVVHGAVQRVFSGGAGSMSWLSTWIKRCLLYGRPLAFAPGLGWAWTLALVFLAFYAGLALLFRSSMEQCVHTLESQPGQTALAALLGMLLTPVLIVLLCVTVIGVAAVPFVLLALFCASLFGKAVMLAWLGGRVMRPRPGFNAHPALAVLVGGAIVLLLYVVPVLGFLVYKLLGFFGFGAVVYTLLLTLRTRRLAHADTVPHATGVATPAAAEPAPAAAVPPLGVTAASEAQSTAAPTPAASLAAHPPITAAMPHAGFWIRMAALLVDVVLVGFAMTLLRPFGHFHIVILAIYGAVMWKLRGTTVGGLVFDLHVVRLDGRPLDWETAIVRALGCFLSLAVVGLGFIWIAFDHQRQAWHDKIAGTVVVRARHSAPLV